MNKYIGQLHILFDLINEEYFNNSLETPLITIQREKKVKNKIIRGYCSALPRFITKDKDKETNRHEICITLDYIDREIRDTLGTFLHEVAHLYNSQNNINDCSKRQFHNEKFKEIAEKIGLIVIQADKTGWSDTELSEDVWNKIQLWSEQGVINFDYLTIKKVVEPEKEKKPRETKPIFKFRCPCGNEVKSNIENLEAECKACGGQFQKIEK
jgi:hypothetical protein